IIFGLLVALVLIVAMWKVFTKAGQPGWASIIPIYNLYIWCKIVGRPWWWILLMLIPFVNFIICIILCIDLAKSFGKGVGFGIGLISARSYFLPDSRLRQRAISRIRRWVCDAANGAASCVGFHTEFATSSEIVARSSGSNAEARCRLLRLSAGEGETMKLRGCSLRFRNDPSPSPLPYEGRGDPGDIRCYSAHFGLRFSLNAAMPSRASSDSRACM